MNDAFSTQSDFFITGILPELNFRFVLAHLGHLVGQVARQQGADPQIGRQLGETMLAAFFLAQQSTKDHAATLSLHLELEGPPHRLICFARSDGGLRSTVSEAQGKLEPTHIWSGLGKSILHVNLWLSSATDKKKYSSAIQLREADLVKNIQEYIAQSDQILTFLDIQSTSCNAILNIAGYFFQALPDTSADQVDAMLQMLRKRNPAELIDDILNPERAGNLAKLETARNLRILKQGGFYAYCDCNRDKIEAIVRLMGRKEVDMVFERFGHLEIACEFCKKKYNVARNTLDQIFQYDKDNPDPGNA